MYWESDGKYLFPELNFSQFVSQNVKILGRRLYSPSLKDVAMLQVAQLFFFLISVFVCTFFPRTASRRLSILPSLQTNVRNIRKLNWTSSRQATSFKLGECNFLPSILTLRFRNCVIFTFGRSYLLSDSHTNTVISDRFAHQSRWTRQDGIEDRDPAKRSKHVNATYRNIVGRNMLRAFGHRVATCCDMLICWLLLAQI